MKAEPAEGAQATPGRRLMLSVWSAGWVTALLLVAWTRYLYAGLLAAAVLTLAAAIALHVVRLRRARHADGGGADVVATMVARWTTSGLLVIGAALAVAAAAHARFEIIEYNWPKLAARREASIARSLSERMSEIESRALRAAREAATAGSDSTNTTELLTRLDSVQRRTGVDGVALLTQAGDLVAWAGSHRGPIPDRLRTDAPPVYFAERALFSYLYYTAPVPNTQMHAVAAVLVETGFTGDLPASGFASSFRDQVDAEVTFHAGHAGMGGKAIWSLVSQGDTVVRARLIPISQTESRRRAEVAPRIITLFLALAAYALLGVAWIREARRGRRRGWSGLPLVGSIPLFAVAPLGRTLGVQGPFSPLMFVLPAPGEPTLGSMMAVMFPFAALIAGGRRPRIDSSRSRWILPLAALLVAACYAVVPAMLLSGATPALMEHGGIMWFTLQIVALLILTIIGALAMPQVEGAASEHSTVPGILLTAGGVLCLVLCAIVAYTFQPSHPAHLVVGAWWAIPFLCFAIAVGRMRGRTGGLLRWICAGFLAATAVIPHLWDAQLDARLHTAEKDLATLGTSSDPFLDYLLESFGRESVLRFDAGEDSVPLLYGAWVGSGLARESYSTEVTLWAPNDSPTVHLGSPVSVHVPSEDSLIAHLAAQVRESNVQELFAFTDQPHIAHALMVPLGNGEVISVVVPPRRTLDRRFGVAYFLGGVLPAHPRLNLVEARGPGPKQWSVTWRRNVNDDCAGDECSEGWRSEAVVQYPDGVYHAHLLVPIPPLRVRVARASLIIAFDLLLLLGLWIVGAAARGVAPLPASAFRSWIRSFRARITIALFAFFVIPTTVFGYVAYRALAQEVERATQLVAERAAEQAAAEFPSESSSLIETSLHTDTDVLRYHGGDLIAVSSPEALELGVYGAWMPPRVYRALEAGEESGVVDVEALGSQRLLTAYHALQASGTLAVPMPLVSTETGERQAELAHVILFAALIGAILSVALSVIVGRTLAGPIARLTHASTAVGAGRLNVRLPERAPGEFGQLYESFNQMVRRLRRARSREIRTARVLAWGEMARQVAHEIKNPLTPIKLAVQHIRRAYADRHPDFEQILDSSVSQVLMEIDHLSDISRAFSRYGAPSGAAGPVQAVRVDQVIREAMALYRTGDDRIRYEDIVAPDLPPALARPGELKEVLFNLIENARGAIHSHGTIAITADVDVGMVRLDVRDSGSGIEPGMLPLIFDPHFSTRSSGTGLGLAIVRRLVESWGGSVEATSGEGEGAVFTVRMRAADPNALQQAPREE